MVFSRSRKLPVSALRSSWKSVVGIRQGMPTTANWTQPRRRSRPQPPAVTPQLSALPHRKDAFPRLPTPPAFSPVLQTGLALHCPAPHRPASPRSPQKGWFTGPSRTQPGRAAGAEPNLGRGLQPAPPPPGIPRTPWQGQYRSPPSSPLPDEPNPRGCVPGRGRDRTHGARRAPRRA